MISFLSALLRHPYLLAGLGGAIGSVGRVMMTNLITRWTGDEFPFGTIVVNVTGAILMGLLAGYSVSDPGKLLFSPAARTFLMIGVLGGYTTFSSFSLQTLALAQGGEWLYAAGNILISVVMCLLGVWLGHYCATLFNTSR